MKVDEVLTNLAVSAPLGVFLKGAPFYSRAPHRTHPQTPTVPLRFHLSLSLDSLRLQSVSSDYNYSRIGLVWFGLV